MKKYIVLLLAMALVLAFSGCAPKQYAVETDLSNITFAGEAVALKEEAYEALLTAEVYYLLPETLSITVDGEALSDAYYEYTASGVLRIDAQAITGDLLITAQAVEISYGVDGSKLSGLHMESEGAAYPSRDFTAVLTPEEGLCLPETIQVVIGGQMLDASAYTYDPVTGSVTVPREQITGDIQIIGEGISPLVGTWETVVDVTEYISDCVAQENPLTASYFQFHDLSITVVMKFQADGGFSITMGDDFVEDLMEQAEEATGNMLVDIMAAADLEMSVEEYLTLMGMTLEDFISDSISLDTLGLDTVDFSGMYFEDGDQLYWYPEGGSPAPENRHLFTLEEDVLTIEAGSGTDAEAASVLYPLVLNRMD